MEYFDAGREGLGLTRVITLERGERFTLSAPGVDDPYEVSTVTVFGVGPGNRCPYFTVAGDRVRTLAANGVGGERLLVDEAGFVALDADGFGPGEPFGEVEHEFTDSGVLPPHVRGLVEPLVPVTDTPFRVRNPEALKAVPDERFPGADVVLRRELRRNAHNLGEFHALAHPDALPVSVPVVGVPKSVVSPFRGRS